MASKEDIKMAVDLGLKAANALIGSAEEMRRGIYIDEFRQMYLPILATPGSDWSPWFRFVTDPRAVTDVYDRSGKLMYTVPAMAVPIGTQVSGDRGESYYDKIQRVMLVARNNPKAAIAMQEQAMHDAVVGGGGNKHILDNRIKLNKILVAEGYPPLPIPGTNGFTGITEKDTQPNTENQTTNETLAKAKYTDEYDEL